uniref:Uncharacterized protein n=1 Tax=Lepeophtheirus salmonis TaxID=72036 RepID=A0A0K2U5N4_LEPSM
MRGPGGVGETVAGFKGTRSVTIFDTFP